MKGSNWDFNDIPISDFKVTSKIDHVTGEINVISKIAGKVMEEYVQTKSDVIRNALIDMGWTPPPE